MRPALYGRYSSSNQREASIDDQLREDRALCDRMGWGEPLVYTDSEISGERRDRPGYVRLLRDAQAGVFDALVLWDLKRLSRAEDLPQVLARFRFWGVRVITCDGYDSAREDSDIRGWIDGLTGNRYLRDLAKATHRGLKGRALDGASAGGLPYGYQVTETGQRAIREDEAAIVRRIFAEYLAGQSARSIAAALNRECIPAPRGGSWGMSAIRPDRKRGIGILGNPIYVGEQVWNRSRWIKHPDTGRRVRQERPRSEWVTSQHPELAIVDRATWDAAQARINGRALGTPANARPGRPPRHLLSGILRCGECGGPIVAIDRYQYGCAKAKDAGTCRAKVRFRRVDAERALLAGVRSELASEAAFQAFQRAVAEKMRRHTTDVDALRRQLAKVEREHGNLMAAIRAGIFTTSTKAELERLERDVETARQNLEAGQRTQPAKILPRAREVWSRMLDRLGDLRDKPAARDALRRLVGDSIPVRMNENGDPVAEIAASSVQINVVAGAGSVPYLTGPLLIPLGAAHHRPCRAPKAT